MRSLRTSHQLAVIYQSLEVRTVSLLSMGPHTSNWQRILVQPWRINTLRKSVCGVEHNTTVFLIKWVQTVHRVHGPDSGTKENCTSLSAGHMPFIYRDTLSDRRLRSHARLLSKMQHQIGHIPKVPFQQRWRLSLSCQWSVRYGKVNSAYEPSGLSGRSLFRFLRHEATRSVEVLHSSHVAWQEQWKYFA